MSTSLVLNPCATTAERLSAELTVSQAVRLCDPIMGQGYQEAVASWAKWLVIQRHSHSVKASDALALGNARRVARDWMVMSTEEGDVRWRLTRTRFYAKWCPKGSSFGDEKFYARTTLDTLHHNTGHRLRLGLITLLRACEDKATHEEQIAYARELLAEGHMGAAEIFAMRNRANPLIGQYVRQHLEAS